MKTEASNKTNAIAQIQDDQKYSKGYRPHGRRRKSQLRPCSIKPGKALHGWQKSQEKRGRTRTLPYEQIRNLRHQGHSGAAISRHLHVNQSGVAQALRAMGIGTRRKNHNREVLPDGRVRCSGPCQKVKVATEFNGSVCLDCTYDLRVRRWNENLDRNLRKHYFGLRSFARHRGDTFTITEEEFKAKYVQQNGRCFYDETTVMDLQFGNGRPANQISADRLEADGPYSNENTVLTTLSHNAMRHRIDPVIFKSKLLSGELPAKKQQKKKATGKTHEACPTLDSL